MTSLPWMVITATLGLLIAACGQSAVGGGASSAETESGASTPAQEAAADEDGGSAGSSDTGGGEATGGGDGGKRDDGEAGPTAEGGSHADAGKGEGALNGAMAFPPPGGNDVCADAPLRITFSGPPTLGASGKIQVFASTGTAVATVDMGAAAFTDVIGGTTFNTVRPAYVDGNDAVIYLKTHALAYGQTYYVNVAPGAILGPNAAPFAVTDKTSWRFTTAAAAPSTLASLAVALNGAAPFCTVQGAIDALPAGNTSPSTIAIAAGTYHEIVHFASKNNVTLLGADRTGTIIEGTNNNTMNPTTATRSLVGVDASSGLVIDTMTIENLTPQGGSQAEALRLQSCDKCVVRNADIISLQDTLLWSGRLYADNCTIAGNVDFIWGTGAAYFNKCEIKTLGRSGWNVQARNPASTYGYVFVDSKLTADPGVTGQGLGRIDDSVYPASHVAYINCTMGKHIAPAGWTITGGASTSQLRFWEYQSVDEAGSPIDVSQRAAGSTQIAASTAKSMRDPTVVLAGWQPP